MTQQELMPDLPIDPEGLLGANLDDLPKERWPQELVNAIEVLESAYHRAGYSDEAAFALARTGMVALADYRGGRQWYLPRGDALTTALRDAEIYRRARRDNIGTLADEFELTERHVWRIVRQQYALHRRKIQLQLPLGE